jgi:hypothetical protein
MARTIRFYISLTAMIFFSITITTTLQSQEELPRLVDSKDYAVMLSAEVSAETPYIKLTWQGSDLVEKYTIKRRDPAKPFWGGDIAEVSGTETSWIDEDIKVGELYEYMVTAHSVGAFRVTGQINNQNVDSTMAKGFLGYGYMLCGVEAPSADESYGDVLLLIDETMEMPLAMEIERLADDLAVEGWGVIIKYVPRTENFDGNAVKSIKSIISDEYTKSEGKLSTVFILGRVAVPYSGNINPDGHPDHIGAWPADVYYGILNESIFTDNVINNDTTANRQENKNIIGDGKFDVSKFSINDVELGVGRVDFNDMPMFYEAIDTEIELLRNYLNKDHAYRTNQMQYGMRAMIEENFKVQNKMYEGFASTGWRNFSVMVGHENVTREDWLAKLSTESYLWSYGTGGGSYTSCGGIATSQEIADAEGINSVFMMLFGSYFGDWDSRNNILRAPLCTNPSALTNCWSARPSWFMHHMGLGYTIGHATKISQNNSSDYRTMVLLFHPYLPFDPGNYSVTMHFATNFVHAALMGDPTLRMRMGTVPSPENLSVVQPPGEFVEISWDAPSEGNVDHYNVFSSLSKYGPWQKLNQEPLTETSYIDENLVEGEVFYLVKAYQLQEVPSGSFYNDSRGVIRSAGITSVRDNDLIGNTIFCSPNPAMNDIEISIELNEPQTMELAVYDLKGNMINQLSQRMLSSGKHSFSWDLADSYGKRIPAGVYLIKLKTNSSVTVEKIVVLE